MSGGSGALGGNKAIIIVPGIGGTELLYRRPGYSDVVVWISASGILTPLQCSEEGSSVNDIRLSTSFDSTRYGAANTYKKLFDELSDSFGSLYSNPFYDVQFFSYDWRFSCAVAGAALAGFINARSYKEVILVAHSMGGLVASSCLATGSSIRNKVKKLITVGTPYLGAPKAVYVMETGGLFEGFLDFLFSEGIKAIANNMPGVYQLLPPSRYFDNYVSKNGVMLNGYTATTNFLKTLSWCKRASAPYEPKPMIDSAASYHAGLVGAGMTSTGFSDVDTYKIYGDDVETVSEVRYDASGKHVGTNTANGDGTVLSGSARNGVFSSKTFGISGANHTDLIKNTDAINRIISIISGTAAMLAPQRQPVYNEKGWPVGPEYEESNKRIYVFIGGGQFDITTSRGEPVIEDYSVLYKIKADGSREKVGVVLIAGGDYEKEYVLVNGEYYFVKTDVIAPDGKISEAKKSESVSFQIEYSDSGYVKKVVKYEKLDVSSAELLVRDHTVKESVCRVDKVSGVVEPALVRTGTDLGAK
jgi:pimeloyl-ACP methyl ester carboxylesterase